MSPNGDVLIHCRGSEEDGAAVAKKKKHNSYRSAVGSLPPPPSFSVLSFPATHRDTSICHVTLSGLLFGYGPVEFVPRLYFLFFLFF